MGFGGRETNLCIKLQRRMMSASRQLYAQKLTFASAAISVTVGHKLTFGQPVATLRATYGWGRPGSA
jgi:hypothetical protein